jgi:signal transduction histidine kinase
MTGRGTRDHLTSRSHRLVGPLCYLIIFAVALRRVNELDNAFSIGLALGLLGLFTILYASEPRLTRRFRSFPRLYFAVQMILIQVLGLFEVYLDTWALLYTVLGFQVAARCPRKEALIWGGLFAFSTLLTLSLEFGLISGVGRALAILAIGVFLVSFDIQYSRHEEALAESQMLLAELQEAHQKLAHYAAQVDKLAAAQEHDRLIHELYDSVGQKVFAIQLAAEAVRLMLEADPSRAAEQIDELQEQTQYALSQMRQLIGQWRPI